MSYLLRSKQVKADNIAVGSATGKENIASGSAPPADTTNYGGGELLRPSSGAGHSSGYGIENVIIGSSSSPPTELR